MGKGEETIDLGVDTERTREAETDKAHRRERDIEDNDRNRL